MDIDDSINSVSDDARDDKVAELDILRQSLEDKKKQSDDYYDQLLRMKAEFDNYRRRTEKERSTHISWGKEEILLKQVSILDILEQALASTKTSMNVESILQGLEMITREFVRMLSSEGITEMECAGKQFDPALHEAFEQVASDQPEGTIVAVLQKGYMMNGRVVRPARVQVAAVQVADSTIE
ncbi:MAG: nucleotide exchange factor GrpE [Elusimicrobia bacterium]|nr:nucleotide exchange factor GrpE [Elusimicrobiota bacterium]